MTVQVVHLERNIQTRLKIKRLPSCILSKKQELPLLLPSIPHIQFRESLISPIQISRINLLPHIIQTGIIPVCDNRLAHLFELLQIIYHTASKEGASLISKSLPNKFNPFCIHVKIYTLITVAHIIYFCCLQKRIFAFIP